MILLALITLLFLPSNDGFITSFRVHNSNPLRFTCDELPYRTAYIGNRCYFASTKEVKFSEAAAECSSIFPGAQMSSNTSDDIFNTLMLDKSAFHVGKNNSGAKQSICIYDNRNKRDNGNQTTTEENLPKGLTPFIRLQYSQGIQFFKLETEQRWGNNPIFATSTIGRILPPGTVISHCECLIPLTRRQELLNIFQLTTTYDTIGQSTVAGINHVLGLVGKTSGCCGATVPIYEHKRQYYEVQYSTYDYNTTREQSQLKNDYNNIWTVSANPLFYIWPAALNMGRNCDVGEQSRRIPGKCVASANKKTFYFQGITAFIRLQYHQGIQFFKLETEKRWGNSQIFATSTLGRILPPGTVMPECNCLISLTRRHEWLNLFQLTTSHATIGQYTVGGINAVLGLVGKTSGCCGATVPIYEHKRQYYEVQYSTYDYNTTRAKSKLRHDYNTVWTVSANPLFFIWPAA